MAPQDQHNHAPDEASQPTEMQSLFIIRHGDRWDYSHPEWVQTAQRRGDPPLSTLGHVQAQETGVFINSLLEEQGITGDGVTWLSSPFLRTIQTSNECLNAAGKNLENVQILPENSVWELDGHGGKLHADLPPIEERAMYFPRINTSYESLYTPVLPEPRSEFLGRCDRAVEELNRRYKYSPRTAIVIVSHAAACIGLARAAANVTLQDINPAGPCGIFRLTRTSNVQAWELDHHSRKGAMNAYSDHLTDCGVNTVPWNHFGDKAVNKGYTGPPVNQDEL